MMLHLAPTAAALQHAGVAYAPQIAASAARYSLDPALLAAVAAQETGGPGSNAGRNIDGDNGHGRGLFQIDDRFHAFAASGAAMDPAANAEYAARMLRGLLDRYHGNIRAALQAYNAGDPRAVGTQTRWGDGALLGYADSVLRHERRIAEDAGPVVGAARTTEAASPSRLPIPAPPPLPMPPAWASGNKRSSAESPDNDGTGNAALLDSEQA
ncbi:MAG: transglycosylase SLT domain-containing protein [Vulcanimicrobiaceae bacterium]